MPSCPAVGECVRSPQSVEGEGVDGPTRRGEKQRCWQPYEPITRHGRRRRCIGRKVGIRVNRVEVSGEF
jgi:hypothetical protein